MEFFDKKEEVLDIELTPYGEFLLAKGKFKPDQYAFFDEEIMYDGEYGNIAEFQNEIKDRIKGNARIKPWVIYKSVEKPTWKDIMPWVDEVNVKIPWIEKPKEPETEEEGLEGNEPINRAGGIDLGGGDGGGNLSGLIDPNNIFIQAPEIYDWKGNIYEDTSIGSGFDTLIEQAQTFNEQQYALPLPLGRSSLSSKFHPAWDVKYLYGRNKDAVEYLSTEARPYLNIPQMDVDIIYTSALLGQNPETLEYDDDDYEEFAQNAHSQPVIRLSDFEELHEDPVVFTKTGFGAVENTAFVWNEDYLVLEINEKNVPFSIDNFDIEVFKMEELEDATGFPITIIEISSHLASDYDGKYIAFYPAGRSGTSAHGSRIVFWFDGTGSTVAPVIPGGAFIKIDFSEVPEGSIILAKKHIYKKILEAVNEGIYSNKFSAKGVVKSGAIQIHKIAIKYLSNLKTAPYTAAPDTTNADDATAFLLKIEREKTIHHKQLFFTKPPPQTKNGLLLSAEEQKMLKEKELESLFIQTDSNYVDYYFNIFVDNEIDPEMLCKVVPEASQEQKGVFVYDPLDCELEEGYNIPIEKIYDTDADSSGDLPDCD